MDATLYEDNSAGAEPRHLTTVKDIKAIMTLDIPSASMSFAVDGGVLRLESPEFEGFEGLIVHQEPKTASTPTTILFPKSVTQEQEEYAKGFLQALEKLHRSNGQPWVVATDSSSGIVSSTDAAQLAFPFASSSNSLRFDIGTLSDGSVSANLSSLQSIEMPQTVPCVRGAFPSSPEDGRLELKRARNRIAAQKCRTRKIERIAELSKRVRELKMQNVLLLQTSSELQNQLEGLKLQLMQHVTGGCQVLIGSLAK